MWHVRLALNHISAAVGSPVSSRRCVLESSVYQELRTRLQTKISVVYTYFGQFKLLRYRTGVH